MSILALVLIYIKILIKEIQAILFLLIKAKLVHSAFEKCHTRGLSFK